jgi:hypothetical protein
MAKRKARRKFVTSRGVERKRGSIIAEILGMIIGDLDAAMSAVERPWEFKAAMVAGMSQAEWQTLKEDKRRARALKVMKQKKWITDRKQGDRIILSLSTDALTATLKQRIIGCKRKLSRGQTCLVCFDYPVGANQARAFWRRFLKAADFTQVQLSVWGTNKDVATDIVSLVCLTGAGNWVKVFVGSRVSN